MSLINWLKNKPTPRFSWSSRAGYGIREESQRPILNSFGLLRFDSCRPSSDLWKPFGESRFVVPKEIIRSLVKPSSLRGGVADEAIQKPVLSDGLLPASQARGRNDKQTKSWTQMVEQALASIQNNQIQKVVLARKQVLSSQNPINPILLFEKLTQFIPDAHHFFFEPEPGVAFIGASPERLYKRVANKIESEAQAGTRIRGQTISEDLELGKELLENPKDHQEHLLVVENISQVLKKICIDYGITKYKHVRKLPNVQHLKTCLAGVLKNSITDQDILETLHPTAAVCGYPREKALELIRQLEKFDRGFYTGSLGYIGQNEAEFNVAIRCAVVDGRNLHIFGGAGIVEASIAENEWQEIENKIAFWKTIS